MVGLSYVFRGWGMDIWAGLTWQAGGKYAVPCSKLGAVSVLDRLRARAGKFVPRSSKTAAAASEKEKLEWALESEYLRQQHTIDYR
jgi:hypothetical protein